jgi:MSHA biogenesis protein MshK
MNGAEISSRFAGLLLCAASLGAVQAALGQSLADPTRPPNVTAGRDNEELEPPANQVQSVLIARGRRIAIVNGTTVRVGDKLGDAVVKSISEAGVVLQYSDHAETLKLLGDIKRRPVRTARSAENKNSRQGDAR